MALSWYPDLSLSNRRWENSADRGPSRARAHNLLRPTTAEAVTSRIERNAPGQVTPPAQVARRVRQILVVDPDPQALHAVQDALQFLAGVEGCADFRAARARLVTRPPDLLITNLRLEQYNGLHLVCLTAGTQTRSIVYSTHHDLVLAREAQNIGAFYERTERLTRALASYVHAALPVRDRRNLIVLDRRSVPRGGRRCSDR